jgi:hypothetical protein
MRPTNQFAATRRPWTYRRQEPYRRHLQSQRTHPPDLPPWDITQRLTGHSMPESAESSQLSSPDRSGIVSKHSMERRMERGARCHRCGGGKT